MSAPPYMKLYVGDYLGDTHHLNALEHGAYLLLLMAMWRAGGVLPTADANLTKIARCTPDEWAAIRDTVLAFFAVRRGKLTHKRVTAEMAKYEDISGKRSEARKVGLEKKAGKNNGEGATNVDRADDNCGHNQNQNQNQKGEADASPDSAGTPAKAKSRRKPEVSIPDGFPDAAALDDGRTRALKDRRDLDVALEAERFRNHAEQTDRRARDWPAAFRNWIIGAMSRAPRLLAVGASAASVPARPFPNAAVREAVVSAKDEPWAVSWLDCCEWDEAEKAVLCPRQLVVDTLRREVPVLERRGAKIKLKPPADAPAPTLFPEDAGRSAA